MIHRSQACLEALAAIEADPLSLPGAVEAHVAGCEACAEARVAWLAMEDTSLPPVPAGYFDHLPARVLRKLPARPSVRYRLPLIWSLAAGFLLAVGGGGFWLGRANRQPLVEATLAPAPVETPAAALPETPFLEGDDEMSQLRKLSPEEAKALLDRLDTKETKR